MSGCPSPCRRLPLSGGDDGGRDGADGDVRLPITVQAASVVRWGRWGEEGDGADGDVRLSITLQAAAVVRRGWQNALIGRGEWSRDCGNDVFRLLSDNRSIALLYISKQL